MKDSEFVPNGYKIFRQDRDLNFYTRGTYTQTSRGGTLLLVKNYLNPTLIETNVQAELCWININPHPNVNIVIGSCYRPEVNENIIVDRICTSINSVDTSNCLLLGDFNFRQINWNKMEASSGLTEKFLNTIQDNLLTQIVDEPTRGNNILDLAFVSDPSFVEDCRIDEPFGMSDHKSVVLSVRFPVSRQNTLTRKIYLYSQGDYKSLSNELRDINWENKFNKNSVNDCWMLFKNTYNDLVDTFIPSKTIKPGKRHGQPWTGYKSVTKAKKNRRKKWVMFKRLGLFADELLYDQERCVTNYIMSQAKSDFEDKLVNQVKDNPKRFWNYTRHFSKSSSSIAMIEKDGVKLTNDRDKAEVLNNFFISVLTQEQPLDHTPDLPVVNFDSALCDLDISPDLVRKKLAKLTLFKSSGPDGIHVNVLRDCLDFDVPLSYIFNLSIRSGHVPQDWRDANVTPLFKKGSRSIATNYRPVSLTSQIVKLFERLIQDAIITHITRNRIISCHQHGFQRMCSCITQLIECLNDWTDSFDNKLGTDAIYLDFAKAFDTVPHNRLKLKLRNAGIRGNVLRWIVSFLNNRRQQVVLPGGSSSWMNVTSGVPQGSILGPILFLLYVNDLPDCVNSTAKLFADDTKLYREIIDPDDCQEIQEDLNTLSAWSKIWLLRFNETKCIVLRIRKCFEFIYYLNGIPLIEEDNQRDLGVIISNNLHPDYHISHIVKKANQRIGLIRRCFTNLTSEKVSILYKSIVSPILEYGSTVWSPYLVKDIEALDKVQRRCTRISNHPFHIEPLELRRRRQDMCEVYKYLHHSYKTNTDNLFKLNTSITRGHNFKLTKHFARTDVRKKFFSNRVVNYWNDLPSAVVSAPTLDSFKRRLRSLPDW